MLIFFLFDLKLQVPDPMFFKEIGHFSGTVDNECKFIDEQKL